MKKIKWNKTKTVIITWYKKVPKEYAVKIPDLSYRQLEKLTGMNYTYLQKLFTGKAILEEKKAGELVKKLENI